MQQLSHQLIEKYNKPVPRYTSYPTVPYWHTPFSQEQWLLPLGKAFASSNRSHGISLYIHLPFCDSLCTYCGCFKKITRKHSVEDDYLTALAKEWTLYLKALKDMPIIRELHLGGGTPTFFSPDNLVRLMKIIFSGAKKHPDLDMSIEGHPNNTSKEHLAVLYAEGFRRISYGVQDLDQKVQHIINRIQPFEVVEKATTLARQTGFASVNFDLIYGLPRQTLEGLQATVDAVITLRPDRIAFYSYAHVPWTSKGQRLFDENDLPDAATKMQLYRKGREMLLGAGYADIGMDHYAQPGEALHQAWTAGKLHRNFMGYTTQETQVLIGLGASSISDCGTAFAQNVKSLQAYYEAVEAGIIPITKGYQLSPEDLAFRRHILDITCKGSTCLHQNYADLYEAYLMPALKPLISDGLAMVNGNEVKVTDTGRNFLRNIASAFDLFLQNETKTLSTQFSKAI